MIKIQYAQNGWLLTCSEEGEPDTYISLKENLTREEVYTVAMECMNLGKAIKQ